MALLQVSRPNPRFRVTPADTLSIRRTRLTLCPSPSTTAMLHSQSFDQVSLWPRGVDLGQFSRSNRSKALRATWGVCDPPVAPRLLGLVQAEKRQPSSGVHHQGRKASLPLTPPESPASFPVDKPTPSISNDLALGPDHLGSTSVEKLQSRVVLLYVGRM